MNSFLFVASLSLATISWASGTGTHGGNHIKERFLLAKEYAVNLLSDQICLKVFKKDECKKMSSKLRNAPLDWYENSNQCLKAVVRGHEQCVTAKTTPELKSVILIDILAATRTKISFQESVILLIHEAGHSIGLSEDYITDKKIIKILPKDLLKKADKFSEDASWVRDNFGSLQFCKNMKEALEKIFETEIINSTGALSLSRDIQEEMRSNHRQILDEVALSLSQNPDLKLIDYLYNRRETRSRDNEDDLQAQMLDRADKYIQHSRNMIIRSGFWQDPTIIPSLNQDIRKSNVTVRFDNSTLVVQVCSFHYANTQLVNGTHVHQCSTLKAIPKFSNDQWAFELERDLFVYIPGVSTFEVNGQDVAFKNFPEKDIWVLKQLGVRCERLLKNEN